MVDEAIDRGHIKDAWGKPVALLDPCELTFLRRHDVIPRDPLGEIAEEIGPGMTKWRHLAFWVGVILVLVFLVTVVIRECVMRGGLRLDSVERMLWLLILMLFSFGVWRTRRSAQQGRSKRVQSVMLKHLRCPHCGYDIRGLPTDPADGATICPECGCAWKVADPRTVDGDGETVTDVPCAGRPRRIEEKGSGREGTSKW